MTENELARLRWQCRRGCKELDLLLGDYINNHYLAATPLQKAHFNYLLTLDDDHLLRNWSQLAEVLAHSQ